MVGLMGFGSSAFTSAETVAVKKGKLNTYNYGYNSTTGDYDLISGTPSTSLCSANPVSPRCIVVWSKDGEADESISQEQASTLPKYSPSTSDHADYF